MDKYIYDESNGLWYELQGDYYIPCLILPTEEEHKPIGLWGQRHKRYLQEHKRAVYITLLTSGKLNCYLTDIDEQATEMIFRLVEQMADKEGVTEQLKVEKPILWQSKIKTLPATIMIRCVLIHNDFGNSLCYNKFNLWYRTASTNLEFD